MIPTLTPSATFSIANAVYFATASSLAYNSSDANFGAELTAQLGFGGTNSPFGADVIFAYLMEDANAVTLAFRGTWDFKTAEDDAAIVLKSDPAYPNAKVHTGFCDALNSLWGPLSAAVGVSGAAKANKPFFIAGHSLGGALATLASMRFKNSGVTPTAVYTFGSPRVGNIGFFDTYSCVNYRVVNRMDVVPHVPLKDILTQLNPQSVLLNFLHNIPALAEITYKHVGTLDLLTTDGQLSHDEDDWDSTKKYIFGCIQGILPQLQGAKLSIDWLKQFKPQMLTDHFIANYIQNLTALL